MRHTLLAAIGVALLLGAVPSFAGQKLTGTPIGTTRGFDYSNWTMVENIQGRAFDGDLTTCFATEARSYTWVGLDLGAPHVIDRVGWSPRNDSYGPGRLMLGIIQGANREDWLDAVPIYMITEPGETGYMSRADVDCSKGFRYVRFVGTSDSRCNIAELEFYGTPSEGDESRMFQITNLPTVCINTVDAEEPYDKENDIVSNIVILSEGKINVDKPGTVRERGNASRTFPKKPWRIKFDKKQNVLDAPAKAKKWTLINNYGDKTLMRNLIAFEIAKRLNMKYVPYARAVDVILNGEYKGCYQLCDQVEVNPGRVEIDEMETTDIDGDALTGGYLVEVDAYADQEPAGEWFKTSSKGIPVTIKSPNDGGTPEQYAYIRNFMNDLESRVFAANIGSGSAADYREMFDVDSFLQHMIVGELSGNTDTYWSTYMYKPRGEYKMYTGPVWDFDIAFDNDYRTYPISRLNSTLLFESWSASSAQNMNKFVSRILRNDPRSEGDLSRIWSAARNRGGISEEAINQYIDGVAQEIDASQKLNFIRWPILSQKVHQNPVATGSFETEVGRVKSYISDRIPVLDKLMKYVPASSGVIIPEGDEQMQGAVSCGDRIILPAGDISEVYTTDGRLVYRGGEATNPLCAGLYIVKSGHRSTKVLVGAAK